MQAYISTLGASIAMKNGIGLGKTLSTFPDQNKAVATLIKNIGNCDRSSLEIYKGTIASPWDEVAIAIIQVVTNRLDENYSEAYREQAHLVNNFFRFFNAQPRWVLPALDVLLKELRTLAFLADQEAKEKQEKSDSLEDAARICNKAFTNCLTDRANKLPDSRKWGTYRAVGVTLKCYIKADKMALHKSLLRSLTVQIDMPPFEAFPRADRVTCKYYFGLLAFLNEEWDKAHEEFDIAFKLCLRSSHRSIRNQELILTYLIPLQILRGRLPSTALLARFDRLRELYAPFITSLRSGDLQKFDATLLWAEKRLLETNTWIAMEKAREICLRGLLRQVWRASDKTTRLPIASIRRALQFSAALSNVSDLASGDTSAGIDEATRERDELDEAECITANMIFRGFLKGYISHEKRMLVLAAKDTFPALSTRTLY